MNNSFSIRPATLADAEHIALAVCMAVGYDSTHALYPVFLQLARMEHSQYSYLNALVAEVDGAVVAALVGYDGALLKQLRAPIFPLLEQYLGEVINIEDETEAGEFYLDSLGVVPDYRGRGIGRALIEAMRDRAFTEGHERVGLIVDVDNHSAERLYQSLGFRCVGNKLFLGHAMHHLQAWR
jgi:ribosomal protein S18 acetylase RimI-like enzyme